jgi:hypothetical protein
MKKNAAQRKNLVTSNRRGSRADETHKKIGPGPKQILPQCGIKLIDKIDASAAKNIRKKPPSVALPFNGQPSKNDIIKIVNDNINLMDRHWATNKADKAKKMDSLRHRRPCRLRGETPKCP